MLDQIDDIWMVDHAQRFYFCVGKSLQVLVSIQNLDCVLVSLVILCNLDLAACAFAERPADAKVFEDAL